MSRARVYAQLVRLPNVFTAMADIGLGVLASGGPPRLWPQAILLLLASSCLYCGGMVWNDFFDLDQDRRERPFRPLPSGRVTPAAAARLGVGLLTAGLVLAYAAGWAGQTGTGSADGHAWRSAPVVIAAVLAAAILLYDGWLKRTWAGPLAMGACRFLNVLLGWQVAVAAGRPWTLGVHLACVVGLYIVGVTWFARTEARTSSQSALRGAALVMLASLVLALPVPEYLDRGTPSFLFTPLLVGLGFLVGITVCQAIALPLPSRVQLAVKRAILGLVVLDAVLATALVGEVGLVLLVLLLPALYLGRWIYST
ncbi:MAG TPA: UbiA family prenyltransferase [Gemmataceae bacterium]|jgi:4-hydroxybenzoate polyprenyltransferase|nr:UbiA family prenyltransferase [Gemmataceae bacterium]